MISVESAQRDPGSGIRDSRGVPATESIETGSATPQPTVVRLVAASRSTDPGSRPSTRSGHPEELEGRIPDLGLMPSSISMLRTEAACAASAPKGQRTGPRSRTPCVSRRSGRLCARVRHGQGVPPAAGRAAKASEDDVLRDTASFRVSLELAEVAAVHRAGFADDDEADVRNA